jgi:hypothetical protein
VTSEANTLCGSVVGLWRYPVKSMMGEELNATRVGPRGLHGDRAYAIVDPDTGKIASAKNPKKWPHLFDCRAALLDASTSVVDTPGGDGAIPPVLVTLPDGQITRTDDAGFAAALTAMLGRPGMLQTAVPDAPILEEYWPDMEELDHRDLVTDESLPEGTFFDLATVHILTTGTLDGLRAAYPDGRFEARRFRPNIIVETSAEDGHFPESGWIGGELAIGDEVRMQITGHCPRCVMTTLPQGDLPRDPGILRTAAQHNEAHVGIYAEVAQGGAIRRGDSVRLV